MVISVPQDCVTFIQEVAQTAGLNVPDRGPSILSANVTPRKYVEALMRSVEAPKQLNFPNGVHYDGPTIYGVPQGHGVMSTADASFQGSFKNGRFNGHGVWANNSHSLIYNGEFHDGNFNGKGVESDAAHTFTYIGEFRRGLSDGAGVLSRSDYTYRGSFKDGQANGPGEVLIQRDGKRYEGTFVNGMPPAGSVIANERTYQGNGGPKETGRWPVERQTGGPSETMKIGVNGGPMVDTGRPGLSIP
jgi:hypothetical protein